MLNRKIKSLFNNNKSTIYFVTLFISICIGIFNPVTATHLTILDVNEILIGTSSFIYYSSIIFGTIVLQKIMNNRNIKVFIIIGAINILLSTASFPLTSNIYFWFILKSLTGLGASFIYVGIQTMLQNFTEKKNIGIVSGLYSVFFAFGFILGSIIGPILYSISKFYPFFIASTTQLLLIILLLLSIKKPIILTKIRKENIHNKISLSLLTIIVYGFTESIIMNILPIYILEKKIATEMVGYVLGVFILGSLIATIPMTSLSDKIGRKKSIFISIVIGIFSMTCLVFSKTFALFIIFGFIAGLGIGPIYALSLSLVAQTLTKQQLPYGNALFTMCISIGAAIGPFISSLVMEYIGSKYLFISCIILYLILLARTYYSIKRDKVTTFSQEKIA